MKKFQSVRGMRDILPSESRAYRALENILISTVQQYGYEEIKTPILEDTNLFIKSIGNGTDIVDKEMYTFVDSKSKSFSMRPEGTASCVRAIIENGLQESINKLWYSGPFFRHERPQKGRYRQFHQFGIEFIGVKTHVADFEIINLANSIWKNIGISPQLKINNIGDPNDRKKYIEILKTYLNKYKSDFDDNEKNKLINNTLRILDSKNPKIKEIIESAPRIEDYISSESQKNFQKLLKLLNDENISYTRDYKLVRGLDYYNNLVFEYTDDTDVTQNTLCAGGRYDFLFKSMCDKEIPALGFAIGMERLLEHIDYKIESSDTVSFYMAILDEKYFSYSQKVSNIIRNISKKYNVSTSYNFSNLKAQLKKANKISANYCVIIGDEEVKNNECQIKDMASGSQKIVNIDELNKYLEPDKNLEYKQNE